MDEFTEEIREWCRQKEIENKDFIGYELDENKLRRLKTMDDTCKTLIQLDEFIKQEFMPFDSSNRNAGVQLALPCMYFTADKKVTTALAKLYALADHVVFSSCGDDEEKIYLSFMIADIWKEHGKLSEQKKK